MRFLLLTILLLSTFSCRMPDNFGFYQPITMRTKAPDGPPEYKAGWHAGCQSALGTKVFANAWVYGKADYSRADVGSGVYQHDKIFQMAFGQGFFACDEQMLTFVYMPAMQFGPLE